MLAAVVGSHIPVPVRRCTTSEWPPNRATAHAATVSGSWRCSQLHLAATFEASGADPTTSLQRSPNRVTSSSCSTTARLSLYRIAGRSGRPAPSRQIRSCICPVTAERVEVSEGRVAVQLGNRRDGAVPPVAGILLDPARAWARQRVGVVDGGDDRAVDDDRGLDRGRADVDRQRAGHVTWPGAGGRSPAGARRGGSHSRRSRSASRS